MTVRPSDTMSAAKFGSVSQIRRRRFRQSCHGYVWPCFAALVSFVPVVLNPFVQTAGPFPEGVVCQPEEGRGSFRVVAREPVPPHVELLGGRRRRERFGRSQEPWRALAIVCETPKVADEFVGLAEDCRTDKAAPPEIEVGGAHPDERLDVELCLDRQEGPKEGQEAALAAAVAYGRQEGQNSPPATFALTIGSVHVSSFSGTHLCLCRATVQTSR